MELCLGARVLMAEKFRYRRGYPMRSALLWLIGIPIPIIIIIWLATGHA
jgi:hypothetical protein